MNGIAEAMPLLRKIKAYKKLSKRKRLRLEGVTTFSDYPIKRASTDRLVDKFIREGSCRHKRPLGSPCNNLAHDLKGTCEIDTQVCDLLRIKGKRYWLQNE